MIVCDHPNRMTFVTFDDDEQGQLHAAAVFFAVENAVLTAACVVVLP